MLPEKEQDAKSFAGQVKEEGGDVWVGRHYDQESSISEKRTTREKLHTCTTPNKLIGIHTAPTHSHMKNVPRYYSQYLQ